jgi:dihydrofolate synthase / folylpolyglutamate synthase
VIGQDARGGVQAEDSAYASLLARLAEVARSSGVLLGLDRIRAVLARLGDPQRRAVTVQIAGTNGKGSTAAMTEAVVRAAGLRTGLYTSPHLCRFTERIRIDGREVNGGWLAELDRDVAAATAGAGTTLTYFEIATVLAFQAFAAAGAEVVVLETGLGGRLDATTASAPVATAITSVALDHTDMLGPTLADVAGEKAGIAKPGVPLFLGRLPAEADAVVAAVAAAAGAPVRRLGIDVPPAPAAPALLGAHQLDNAALAVALGDAAAVAARGAPLPAGAAVRGLSGVRWPGRLERVGDVLLDCAHNVEGVLALVAALQGMLPRAGQAAGAGGRPPLALVVSIVAGKDAPGMLARLAGSFDHVFCTRSRSERALAPLALAAALAPAGRAPPVVAIDDPLVALAGARAAVGPGGMVVVAGSVFLVGEVRAALLGEPRDPLDTSDPVSRQSAEVKR